MKFFCVLMIFFVMVTNTFSQITSAENKLLSPKLLPGNGLAQYDFFYAGEAKTHSMYIVKGGLIVWSYLDTATTKGEISDAVLMTNGNILFAHQFGISLIDSNKNLLWHYDVPKGHEVHTAQPIGNKHIVYVENAGDSGRVVVVNIKTGKKVKEFFIPIGHPERVHGQFRHARLTNKGTLLVTHMDMGKVCEYNFKGKLLNSINVLGVWGAEPLENGNIVTCGQGVVRIVSPAGDSLWGCNMRTFPDYTMANPQLAFLRPNGNIVVNDWFNQWWGAKVDASNQPVQFVELTPEKKVVWALRSWTAPVNLGPATIIQFLEDNRISEHVSFGKIK